MANWPMRSEEEAARAMAGLNPDLKQCRGPCQKEKPRAEFDVDKAKPDGLKGWCKACRKAKNKAKAKATIEEVIDSLDGNMLALLRDTTRGGATLPHQVQVVEAIMQLLGGVQGFAAYYVADMLAAPPGSQTRERKLSRLLTAIEAISDDGKVSKPRELMTDEELEATINERASRLRIVEGTVRDSA